MRLKWKFWDENEGGIIRKSSERCRFVVYSEERRWMKIIQYIKIIYEK